MSFLRALRAYVGLGPDEDIEDRYLYELNSRRRELDLDELDREQQTRSAPRAARPDGDEVVIVNPRRQAADRPAGPTASHRRGGPDRPSGGRRPLEDRRSTDAPAQPSKVDLDVDLIDELEGGFVDSGDGLDFLGGDPLDRPPDRSQLDIGAGEDEVDDEGGVRVRPRTVRAAATDDDEQGSESVVRSLDSMRAKPRTLAPESFADAKLVADEFKRDIPVLLNLQGLERDLARRLIDFASGICYALDGSMEKIASQVFLLIPETGEVSDEDRRRIEERGYAR